MFKIKKKHDDGLSILRDFNLPPLNLTDKERYKVTYCISDNQFRAYATYITGHVSAYVWIENPIYKEKGQWWLVKHI